MGISNEIEEYDKDSSYTLLGLNGEINTINAYNDKDKEYLII